MWKCPKCKRAIYYQTSNLTWGQTRLNVKILDAGSAKIAICKSDTIIIKDGQTAFDFIAAIGHEHGCGNIIVNKSAICEVFLICLQVLQEK